MSKIISISQIFLSVKLFLFITFASATPTNLLTNPGAENGVSPWYTFGGGPALQASTTEAHSGSYSFLMAGRTQFYHGPAYDIKPFVTGGQLVDGERYTASVWVRHGEALSQNLHLNIKQKDNSGTNYIGLEDETVPPNTWVKIVSHFVLDINGTLSSLELYVISNSGTTYDFFTDDFFLGDLEDYTPPTASTPNNNKSDFIRTSGRSLLDTGVADSIVLIGINVTVPVDASDTPQDIWDVKAVSQKDFLNIASLGFNSIRLLMNYVMFEDDAVPGVYLEDGWHWLDRAVAMADSADLYIMLDMHAPQGGYQSDKPQGFTDFWDGSGLSPNTANQDRLIDLWGAIADRYKFETTILGYDLINEPRPNNTTEWIDYAEQVIAEIRTYDTVHMIVMEVPFISGYTMQTVSDTNVIYDSHYYNTWGYATQYSAHYGNAGDEWGPYDPENPVYVDYDGDVVPEGTPNAVPFDRAYLEDGIDVDLLDFAKTNNVPANVGEYGIVWEAYGEDVGATRWMTDVYDIFDGSNIRSMHVSRFYFSYQGSSFGLYTNWTGFQPSETEVVSNLKAFFENKYTWNGSFGTDWNSPANWDVGVVPGSKTDVFIENTANLPHLLAPPAPQANCKTITLKTGATVTVNTGASLTVADP